MPGEAAEQHRLECDVVHDIGPLGAIESRNLDDRPPGAEETVAAAAPGEWAQG